MEGVVNGGDRYWEVRLYLFTLVTYEKCVRKEILNKCCYENYFGVYSALRIKKVAEAIKSKTDKLFSKGPLSCLSSNFKCPDLIPEEHDTKFDDSVTYHSEKQIKVQNFKMATEQKKTINGVYFRILAQDKFWVAACNQVGFELHMVDKIISEGKPSLKRSCLHYIGLGAIVVNENNEYLLFDEDSTYVTGNLNTHIHRCCKTRQGRYVHLLLADMQKNSHIESKTQHYWLPRNKISEDDLRTIGNVKLSMLLKCF
uniref:Uncharacterized protein n=1 Tax=Ditylenchus dipsaci TaxID=166011 RepID=A0A915E260_9BILA